MTKGNLKDIIGPLATIVGVMLVVGGLMFTLVTAISSKLPQVLLFPGVGQVVLGLICVVGGLLLWRGHTMGKYLLVFTAVGVITDIIVILSLVISAISSNGDQRKVVLMTDARKVTAWSVESFRQSLALEFGAD